MDAFNMYRAIRRLKKGFRKKTPGILIVEGLPYYQGDPVDIINMMIRCMKGDPTLMNLCSAALNCYQKKITFDEVLRAQDAGEIDSV